VDFTRAGDASFAAGVVCEPGSTVRFVLQSDFRIATRSPVFYTNYPKQGIPFDRSKFFPVESQPFDGKKDWRVEVVFDVPGTYDYYLVINQGKDSHRCKSGTVVVTSPVLINLKPVPTLSLCCQTVLTRSLGGIKSWRSYFNKLSQLGYNAIHFTSLNEVGWSRSAYALKDQLKFAPELFGEEKPESEEAALALVQSTFKTMESEYGLMGIVDVVWNHTSTDSEWLKDHPEATYNVENSSYLKPALLLDEALQKFSLDVSQGVYESRGLGRMVNDEQSLTLVCQILENEIFPSLKLWEFFIVDVDNAIHEFEAALEATERHEPTTIFLGNEVECLRKEAMNRESGEFSRFSLKIDTAWAIKLFAPSAMRRIDYTKVKEKLAEYRNALNLLNLPLYEKVNADLKAALSNIANRIRFERIDSSGPRKLVISERDPLIPPYFTKIVHSKTGRPYFAANNGWIWGGKPTENFADLPGSAYLRRELIVWTDLVKLRYGFQPSDSPWLWEHMRQYTLQNARLFHGFRIDNCHSTPISVARYMLDAARTVRPGLYVTAELFTGSEKYDNLFVSQLGINSLIREAMQCPNPNELGAIVHRYGGDPIGSLVTRFPPSFYASSSPNSSQKSKSIPVVPLKPSVPPAFLFDCTHDNQTPWVKRTGEDYLSNMALVSIARLPVGSVAGYDWIVSQNPHVDEERLYPKYKPEEMVGIMAARQFFNELHQRLEREGYTQIHVHQEGDLITIQRHHPITHMAVFCIVHTAFHGGNRFNRTPAPVHIPGTITNYSFCARLSFEEEERATFWSAPHRSAARPEMPSRRYGPSDEEFIGGQDGQLLIVPEKDLIPEVFTVSATNQNSIECVQQLTWRDFRPGSVLVLEAQLPTEAHAALTSLRGNLRKHLDLGNIDPIDANYIMFRCDAEERASTYGARGIYNVPGHGDLVYAGLQGCVSVLDKIRETNDLGHALCNNLRSGNWLMDYTVARLEHHNEKTTESGESGVQALGHWMRTQFDLVKLLPRYLVPRMFDLVVMKAYYTLQYHVLHLAGPALLATPRGNFVSDSEESMVQMLAFSGVQLVGAIPSVSLIDPKISALENRFRVTMAAGLPHFAQGFMRCWGRDTFIAMRGLLLLPGRFEEAREILIGFASTLRHGLIPNLIDSGWNPRYNARDATWWFMQALQSYCLESPEGHAFLASPCVPRLFPSDDSSSPSPQSGSGHVFQHPHLVTMASIVQEIMERHANGIHFRERNAGSQIDSLMSDRGFQVDITLDQETGFLFGGNPHNCGTWMDKMGSSRQAGNFGVPATPRDGAAIELVALLKSTLRWLSSISGSQLSTTTGTTSTLSSSSSLGRSGSFKLDRPSSPSLNASSSSPTPSHIQVTTATAAATTTLSSSPQTNASASPLDSASSSTIASNSITPTPTSTSAPHAAAGGFSIALASSAISPAPFSTSGSSSPSPFGDPSTSSTAVDHEKLKFSAPPEVLPDLPLPLNLPPPLFGDTAKKTRATASAGLEDFLMRKKSTVSVPTLHRIPELPTGAAPLFPNQGVLIKKADGTSEFLSFADWDARIKTHFEKCFYVPRDAREDAQYRVTRQYINRRAIYKDTYKSSAKYTDYQLRPNLCVAMVVAPELFVPAHAAETLDIVEKHLLGPLGMRTLDPSDSHYRGHYDNSNHSDDFYSAGGFSYHLGPEWLWLTGYFMRARLQFRSLPPTIVLCHLQRIVKAHQAHLTCSDWKSLPELTNKDGARCAGSCTNQAWSTACLLEALYDMHTYPL
jgi:glycogen debranching enzyme